MIAAGEASLCGDREADAGEAQMAIGRPTNGVPAIPHDHQAVGVAVT